MMDHSDIGETRKHQLRFRSDGSFRILMLSDLQETLHHDGRTLRAINGLVDEVEPDLVILGGDNCYGPEIHSAEELRAYLSVFTEPMETRRIPWAHIFGNHDHDAACPDREMQQVYESLPYCVSGHTPEEIHGVTNYALPILSSEGDRVAFCVWMLDSNNMANELFHEAGDPDAISDCLLPERPDQQGRWDLVRFDQIMWYYLASRELERRYGSVPGMMVTHIAPWEFGYVQDNPMETHLAGSTVEPLDLGSLNSGLFAAVLERGDVKCMASGHTHMDDFLGEYMGIQLCLDACAGWGTYGIDSLRGGRVFDLNQREPGVIRTHMVRSAKYIQEVS